MSTGSAARPSDGTGGDAFAARRARAAAMMDARDVMLLSAAPELRVGLDTELRYVPDSDLFYLTGVTEPEAVMVLRPDASFVLFVRPRDPERERWTGMRDGVEGALQKYAPAEAHPVSELTARLPDLLRTADRVHARLDAGRSDVDAAVRAALQSALRARPRQGTGVHTIIDPGVILNELRLIKDAAELRMMREAAAISIAGFREAAALIADGRGEWEIEAALTSGFRARRAAGEAFPSIVARGDNATILHYTMNDDVLRAGDFLLLDAGARRGMYCADISRTWAVGDVTSERMAMHDIVREAHDAGVRAVRPGATIEEIDQAARRVLVQGMIDLGLLDGRLDEELQGAAHRQYYPHRTSHWLGLDVHDVGSYTAADDARTSRRLETGMCFTIEPGLYIPADDERAPPGLRGVGIRLENDIHIAGNGVEVLTGALPLDADPRSAIT